MLHLIAFALFTEDKVPKDEDVVAGPWGALMFVLLIAATALLCFSFVKQLRKAKAARDEGVFGDEPEAAPTETGTPGDGTPGGDDTSDRH